MQLFAMLQVALCRCANKSIFTIAVDGVSASTSAESPAYCAAVAGHERKQEDADGGEARQLPPERGIGGSGSSASRLDQRGRLGRSTSMPQATKGVGFSNLHIGR
ncbi:hypothetical protein BHE74_00017085 [Ensete ventricosum]|nr:hypothetical protein BHE74_00017085 [Ensete ventricosum]